ncbi:calcium channel regulatory subunit Yam8 [Schizosaccharomyces japonicus yFS275]|uniref:Calcium channel regulatory subunit Yam8 n=1 Tax=Schizosaccharomyces japonicus (strain yFS275 / FY16936) TaxID=402676 RepID=B6K1F2_SCHJY|nr:calcium channel regulatory subunit Yam8 [Schizosaccharomyces japonicus yFS275]EEB07773.1 calcium channel regulatory subunit Yam8 [Schizosaccharomyces japonicus yFS275]
MKAIATLLRLILFLFSFNVVRCASSTTVTEAELNSVLLQNIEDQTVEYYKVTWSPAVEKTINVTLSVCTTFDGATQLSLYASNSSLSQATSTTNVSYAQVDLGLANLSYTTYPPLYLAVSSEISMFRRNELNEAYGMKDSSSASLYTVYELGIGDNVTYHEYVDSRFLYAQDTDSAAALLITGNLTTNDTSVIPDYEIYVNPANSSLDLKLRQLSHSFCAFRDNPSLLNLNNADRSMTLRGLGPMAKEQFYVKGLNASTTYNAYLVDPNNGTLGGTTFQAIGFTTKQNTTCQLIYDLEFCSNVAYAAPGSPTRFSAGTLAKWYDEQAAGFYKNFTYTLHQLPCNASKESTYSLLRNCTDCAANYKNWLCAVLIPRCTDWARNDTFLSLKNNTSRYPLIDEYIQPGPYKEILPCSYLCYEMAASCPIDFGFTCPKTGRGLEQTYGTPSQETDNISCNAPGVEFYVSEAYTSTIRYNSLFLLVLFWFIFHFLE